MIVERERATRVNCLSDIKVLRIETSNECSLDSRTMPFY